MQKETEKSKEDTFSERKSRSRSAEDERGGGGRGGEEEKAIIVNSSSSSCTSSSFHQHHLRLHQPRGRGRPSKAELLERDRDREQQIAQLFEERGDHYSLILVSINNKLAVQNGLKRRKHL